MEKCGGANRIRVPTHIATTPLSPSIRSGVPVKSTHAFAATRSRPLHRSKLASCRAALQGEALSAPKLSGAYSALSAVSGVYLVSSQSEVAPASLWRPDERCVLLNRDVIPVLDAAGVKLFLVSIGTKERGLEFVEKTGFPAERLLADPEGSVYEALRLKKGLKETFLSVETPRAIWSSMRSGRIADLQAVLRTWTKTPLWHPPSQDQALQQGGVLVFEGDRVVWAHRDPATGAHADLEEVVRVATQGLLQAEKP